MHAIWCKDSCKFLFLRQRNKDCGSIYTMTYIYLESKVFNVSYLLPDYMKNSKYIEIQLMHAIWTKVSCKFIF